MKKRILFSPILTILLFTFSFCFLDQSYAQELARKGTLGIQMKAKAGGKGLEVMQVYGNTTASSLGIQQGDILLKINNKNYNQVQALVDAVDTWKAGDPVQTTIKREGQVQVLSSKVVGKPFERSEYGTIIYSSVDYGGGQLRTILELPNHVENPPVLLFMQGVGCASIDYPYRPNSTVKLLIEEMVKNGIAVFRVEKPGMGDSFGPVGCREMDYPYEVDAFEAALKDLKNRKEFNSENIFLYGESLSSITAPILANKYPVAGIIAWGGVSKSWFEYSLRLMKDQKFLIGKKVASTESRFRQYLPLFYDFFILQKSKDELENTNAYKGFLGSFLKGDQWRGLQHYRFFQTLNDVNVLTAYTKANCPVLALAGEYDVHTIDTSWTADVAYAVNQDQKDQAEIVIFPKTTHHYFQIDSQEVYIQKLLNKEISSAEMADNFNTDIGKTIAEWIKRKI